VRVAFLEIRTADIDQPAPCIDICDAIGCYSVAESKQKLLRRGLKIVVEPARLAQASRVPISR
jgi:hypothetical protein